MKKSSEHVEKAVMSTAMAKSAKAELGARNFLDYMVQVMAVKKRGDRYVVLKYENAEIDEYRERFIKKHEHTLGDQFVFDQLTKQDKWDDEFKKPIPTGWFIPFVFWNFIKNYIL